MKIHDFYPEYEVVRNDSRCTRCRICEQQCANEVHHYDEAHHVMLADESKCVNCQRCVSVCPTRALKIVKSDCQLRENANWDADTVREVYKQAGSGGGGRPLRRGGADGPIAERRAKLPLCRAEMAGRHGQQPIGKTRTA